MKKEWWQDKVAYQIYPKSFFDSNGDGIGDLPGIISKLDYLKELGADILWLSPVYQSPLADQGYDISDYYAIDPRFGTMEDMDRLLAEARKRDLHIVMDLVVNHCSDEHEWFRKACEDPEGEYGGYFYLRRLKKAEAAGFPCTDPAAETQSLSSADLKNTLGADPAAGTQYSVCSPDGYVLPCNWRSYFGGPVWEKLPGHEDWFYLHVFHKKQPDLNWENPKVREEIYAMINWWLDRGLAGFRIDAIINIKKALPFRNYAPDRADGLSDIHNMVHDADGIGEFLGEMRDRTFRPHRAFTVGEVFNEKEGDLPAFIGENGYFSSMFDFSEIVWGSSPAGWHDNKDITPDDYRACLFLTQKKTAGVGFISNIIENHDEPRGVCRYIPEQDMGSMDPEMRVTAKKALATVYFFLKGLPWIYQGQELGMENVPLRSIGEVDDIASLDAWNVMRELGVSEADALRAIERNGRDNARTPFQWSAAPHAGFTSGTPWLRVNPDYPEINLECELSDPASVYRHYRKMTALRKDPEYKETFVYGSFEPWLAHVHNVIAYLRRPEKVPDNAANNSVPNNNAANNKEDGRGSLPSLLIIANCQKESRKLPLPAPVKKVLLNNCPDPAPRPGAVNVSLSGYQTLVLELT